jgi:hypothetical protein
VLTLSETWPLTDGSASVISEALVMNCRSDPL